MPVTSKRGTLGRESFPALFTSRSTRDRSSLSNRHVTKLTCRARHSLIHLPIENDSRADSFFNQHEHKVTHVTNLGPAKPQLSEGRGIRVVVDGYGNAREFLQIGALSAIGGPDATVPPLNRSNRAPPTRTSSGVTTCTTS